MSTENPAAAASTRPSPFGPLGIRIHGATSQGLVRRENQDGFDALEIPADGQRGEGEILVVLADGMGGLSCGAEASRICISMVRETYRSSTGGPDALALAVQAANTAVYARSRDLPKGESMGSTITALAIRGACAWIAHVGDSRAYRVTAKGPIRRLTQDHTLLEELTRRQDFDPESFPFPIHRSLLTRGIGLSAAVEVDVMDLRDVEAGDAFLLCSDGLYEIVDDAAIEAKVREKGTDLEGLVAELIGLALEGGGPDNITVVAARIEEKKTWASGPVRADAAGSEGTDAATPRSAPADRLRPLLLLLAFIIAVCAVALLARRGWDGPRLERADLLEGILDRPEVRRQKDETPPQVDEVRPEPPADEEEKPDPKEN